MIIRLLPTLARAESFVANKVDKYEIKPDGVFFAVWLIL